MSGTVSPLAAGPGPRARPLASVSTGRRPRVSSVGHDNRMSVLLLLALAVSITGLHTLLDEPSWWFAAFGVAFVVFGAAAVARFYVRRRWVPTLAALVAAVLTLTLFFASGASLLGFIPTGSTVAQFQALIAAGNDSIARQSIPAIPTAGIDLLICGSVAVMAVFMDAAANWWRAPALVGIPLVVVVAIPSFIANQPDGFTFVVTAVLYLMIILLSRTRRPQRAVAIVVGAIAAFGALVAPVLLPAVTPGGSNGSGFGLVSENINPIIDLGANLRDTTPTPVLSYTTTASTGEYLQLTTLDDFEGEEWAPDAPALNPKNKVTDVTTVPGLTKSVSADRVKTTVKIDNANSTWLPVPYPEKSVTGLSGTWLWDAGSLAIRSTGASSVNQTYSVSSLDVEPTIQQLRAAPRDPTSALAKVPFGLDPIVAATARKVVGNAKTDFDKAVALQNWFRNTFTYSTKAPAADGYDGTGLDIIAPFLKTKAGYCVHFATTMAIMARTLGIPSRVAVGFLPGALTRTGNGSAEDYLVTTADLHAWPELYFTGIGWVRFEPTPSKGFVPDFPDAPGVTGSSGPTGTATTTPTDTSTTVPKRAPAPVNSAPAQLSSGVQGGGPTLPSAGFGGLGILVALLIVATPALVRIGIRRRRLDLIRRGVDSHLWTWQELRDSARDQGIDAGPAATPRQLAQSLAVLLGEHNKSEAVTSVARLRELVESESFGPWRGSRFVNLAVGDELARNLDTVLRGLRQSSPLRTRLAAFVAPQSLRDRLAGRATSQPDAIG